MRAILLAVVASTLAAPTALAALPSDDIAFVAGLGVGYDPNGHVITYFDQDGNAEPDECEYILVVWDPRTLAARILLGEQFFKVADVAVDAGLARVELYAADGLGYEECTIYADLSPYTGHLDDEPGIEQSLNEITRRVAFDPSTGDVVIDFASECETSGEGLLVYVCPNGDASATLVAVSLCGEANDAILVRTNGARIGCVAADVAETVLEIYAEILGLGKSAGGLP